MNLPGIPAQKSLVNVNESEDELTKYGFHEEMTYLQVNFVTQK